jgi:putative ABC transport system permease protein
MWRATVKSLLGHKFRLALTALSIVLGVSFVAGTYVLTDTINNTFDKLFEDVTAGVDVYVRSDSSFTDIGTEAGDIEPVPSELLAEIEQADGVAYAQGEVSGYAQFVDKDGEAIAPFGPPTLGVSWGEHDDLSALTIREGRKPMADGEVAMDAGTAKEHGFRVGDTVTILTQGPPEEFEIVGIAGFGEADNLGGATLAAFDLETAQRVLNRENEFDAIVVKAEEGVSPQALRQRIAAILPDGVEATTGQAVAAEQSDAIKEGLGFFNTFLLVFAGISLFVGAFIIFNTFNILVTQRTRELALLRALGASGRQVMTSVVVEALIVGVVASAVGLGAGILIAIGLKGLLTALGIELPASGIVLQPRTVIVAMVVGVVVTFVASIFPARRAARVAPIAALRDTAVDQVTGIGRRAIVGGILTLAGVGVLLFGLFGDVSNGLSLVGLGVALTFVGVAGFSPVIARGLAGGIGAPLPRLFGVPGRLGRGNAMRNPKRTASTAAALMIGLALVATFSIMGSSVKASTGKIIEEAYRADYIISANAGFSGFSPEIARQLATREELAVVSVLRTDTWRKPGTTSTQFLTAVDPATVDQVLELDVREGNLADLTGDAVLIHEDAASSEGVSVGDTYPMQFASTGERPMRVVGVFGENRITGDFVIGLDTYEENYSSSLDSFVMVKGAPGIPPDEVRRAIEEVTDEFPNVQVQNQAEIRATQEEQIDQLLNLVYSLLFLAIFIALMGIVNTLALSVYERTRELGLMRALGLSRRQTRSMVRWESVIIALLGGVLGLAIGIFFGWALQTALADDGITELALPVSDLLIFLAVAGLAGVLAAWGPARRAAKLDVLAAIAHE